MPKGPGGRPTKYREEYPEQALEWIGRQGKSVTWFAKHLEVDRSTIYEWAEKQPEFSVALKRAQVWSEATWEDRIEEMMTSRDVNAPLVKLYLANRFGWSDKQTTEHTGQGGGPVRIAVTHEIIDPSAH